MWLLQRLRELWDWLMALPPDFAFLLSLPLVVAIAAILSGLARPR
jgi:hypothetical protein